MPRIIVRLLCVLVIACSSPPVAVRTTPSPTPSPSPSPSPLPSPTAAVLPAGWSSVAKTQFTFGLPPTWRAIDLDPQTISATMKAFRDANPGAGAAFTEDQIIQLVNAGLRAFALDLGPSTTASFATNMNVIVQTASGISLDVLAQASAATLEVQLGAERAGFDHVSIGGRDAVRIRARYNANLATGARKLLATQYFLMGDRDVFILTFTAVQDVADSLVKTFEEIAATFRIV